MPAKHFSPRSCLDHAAQYIGFLPAMALPDGSWDRASIREAQQTVMNALRTLEREGQLQREHSLVMRHLRECPACRAHAQSLGR